MPNVSSIITQYRLFSLLTTFAVLFSVGAVMHDCHMAKRNKKRTFGWSGLKGVDVFNDFDPWAYHRWRLLVTRGEEREKVKDEISGTIRRMEAGISVRDAFALKAMSAKPKPMLKLITGL